MESRMNADEIRFWTKVQKTDGCWIWTGGKRNQAGYGGFTVNGKDYLAYRWLYVLINGEIPAGHRLHLTCENPECVRPDHIVATKKRFALSGPRSPAWKGEQAGINTKRGRARRRYELGGCERCGAKATDRHHKDGNTGNNEPDNIAILCRRCHMVVDGRLVNLRKHHLPVQPPKPCVDCGKPAKPLRSGMCPACEQYLRRNGFHRGALSLERMQCEKQTA